MADDEAQMLLPGMVADVEDPSADVAEAPAPPPPAAAEPQPAPAVESGEAPAPPPAVAAEPEPTPAPETGEVRRAWDDELVERLLADDEQHLRGALDPEGRWGQPPPPEDAAGNASEEQDSCASLPKWLGGKLVKLVRVTLYWGGQAVGFGECAVVRRQPPKQEKTCRICMESECELLDSCCACRGFMRYICTECLMKSWETKVKARPGELANLTCGLCHQSFRGRAGELLAQGLDGEVKKREQQAEKAKKDDKEEGQRYLAEVQLATKLWEQGKYKEAVAKFKKAIAKLKELHGPRSPWVFTAEHNLSLTLTAQGKAEEAAEHVGAAYEGFREHYGEEHPLTLKAAHNKAMIAWQAGRVSEARAQYEVVLAARKRKLGPQHVDTLKTSCNLGLAIMGDGDPAAAEEMLRSTLVGLEHVVGRPHPLTLAALQNLSLAIAQVSKQRGELAPFEAEELAREAAEGRQRILGPDHPETMEARKDLGAVLRDSGKIDEAEEVLRQALSGMERLLGFEHRATREALERLHDLLLHHRSKEEAAKVLDEHKRGQGVSGASALKPAAAERGPLALVLLSLYVAPAYRRRGLGRLAVAHFSALGAELRAEGLEACVPDDAPDAAAFFAALGFAAKAAGAAAGDAADGGAAAPGQLLRLRLKRT